jgi:hypothetical protein
MNYSSWDFRGISFFKEELSIYMDKDLSIYPSISDFRQTGLYSKEVRRKLCDYLATCPIIVSTSYKRLNAYTSEPALALSYFTDGEFVFTDLFQTYIHYDDFVLPEKWFSLIENKNFTNEQFELDYDKIASGIVDVFGSFDDSFDRVSRIRAAMLTQ